MKAFTESKELIKFAKSFIDERLNALEKDVHHCLIEPFAPFPAISICFSTIDLLGSLYAGDASRKANTTRQSKSYMQHFMYYTEEQTELLLGIFRHKIVHLAQPKAVIEHNGENIYWHYHHNNPERHLKLTKLIKQESIQITQKYILPIDHKFEISISSLVDDIKDSVYEPEGYMHLLKKTPDLQDKFDEAIFEIYNPK